MWYLDLWGFQSVLSMANTIYASIYVEAYSKISTETHHLASEQPQGRGSSRWAPKVCPGHGMSRPLRGAIRSGAAPRDLFFAFSWPNTFVIYIFGWGRFHFFIFLFLQTRNRSLGHNGENDRLRTDIQKTLEIEQGFVPPQYLAGAGKHVFSAPNALKTS